MHKDIQNKILLFIKIYLLFTLVLVEKLYSQDYIKSNIYTLPANRLLKQFEINSNKNKKRFSHFNLSTNYNFILNSGHPNIDNYGNLFIAGKSIKYTSFRFEFFNSWLFAEIEPYQILYDNNPQNNLSLGNYKYLNNHYSYPNNNNTDSGLKQSQLIIHYKGIGFGYGNINHWWGPGFHSALALASNASSQETFSIGTFHDQKIGKISFGIKLITMPYRNNFDEQIYFSGLKANMTFHTDPIISVGIHRTFLSGDISELYSDTEYQGVWSIEDATRLVLENLFTSNKTQLNYTRGGSGNDYWDQVLTGFIKITFPNDNLELYLDLASDDNRKNLTDLKAHWDHTLGYMLGFKKLTKINKINLFTGAEYLTTRGSNTLKPEFYRGPPNGTNFYANDFFDSFSYQGRRMGAHSGSSSDDLIFMLGFSNDISTALMSYNKERHGIKSMTHPELKTEYILTYHRKITPHHTAFITLEYEHIKNFGFIQNNTSVSKLIWFGYSFSIN